VQTVRSVCFHRAPPPLRVRVPAPSRGKLSRTPHRLNQILPISRPTPRNTLPITEDYSIRFRGSAGRETTITGQTGAGSPKLPKSISTRSTKVPAARPEGPASASRWLKHFTELHEGKHLRLQPGRCGSRFTLWLPIPVQAENYEPATQGYPPSIPASVSLASSSPTTARTLLTSQHVPPAGWRVTMSPSPTTAKRRWRSQVLSRPSSPSPIWECHGSTDWKQPAPASSIPENHLTALSGWGSCGTTVTARPMPDLDLHLVKPSASRYTEGARTPVSGHPESVG